MDTRESPRSRWFSKAFWQQIGRYVDNHSGGLWSILKMIVVNYGKHECTIRASAIAYYILLSFFPLVLLLIVLSGPFLTQTDTHTAVTDFIDRYLPWADELIQLNIEQLMRRRGLASIVSVLSLLWSGSNMFASIHRSLDIIWDVKEPKPFWWQRLLSIAAVGVIVAMFGLSLGIAAAGNLIRNLPEISLGQITLESGQIWGWVTMLISLLPTILLSFTIYRLLANAPLKWWELLPGSIVAALLWEIGKQIFANYVISFQPYNLVYGSLGKLIAFIIWSYFTGMILLLGAELTLAWKTVRAQRRQSALTTEPSSPVRQRAADQKGV